MVPEQNPLTGVKVMVIDDSNTIRRSAEIFLLQAGCTVILAEDGFDALAKITDHQPNLVFVDIMMPRLDGYGAARRIRRAPWGAGMLLVAQTGWGQESDRRLSEEAGFDFHLTKPVDLTALRRILTDLRGSA